jgi:glycosyltransferase involved in cell wall biosynthesis
VPDAHFVFLGSGRLAESLRAQAGSAGLSGRVHFIDAVPWRELHEWTASADAGLQLLQNTCLNHYTTDSNKLFEYAIAGLPVIASDFPEIRRIVEDWGFGLLVDPADKDAVVRAMQRLSEDSGLRERLADAAINAAPHLTWRSQAPALLVLYRNVLSNGSGSA